ncbi:hypothetical protein [Thiocapsa roseopersicina]|uniref:Uncharacterized protein n=1 Tax=Thiocapsa roseopersicina TaxID=1058 RepID=A0A1H3CNF8_THIRO|nr:hypothetical protein [Thiocapsa roseopersicina]SDX55645.1 hypothetical protein SAMN05421783_1368 [Thiocapsa roseopersicina]
MNNRLHIFHADCSSPATGSRLSLCVADLAATAKAYDPGRHQAQLFIGHPKDLDLAHGYVNSLEAVGGDLYANVVVATTTLIDGVRAGELRRISASFWSPKHPENPTPGTWSLRHIGFFGGAVPEESGLDPIDLSGCSCHITPLTPDPIEQAARCMAGLPPIDFAAIEDDPIERAARIMAGQA